MNKLWLCYLAPIPELTIRVAQAAFPYSSTFILIRDSLGTIFTDQDFADLFPDRGQPALSPWRTLHRTKMIQVGIGTDQCLR